MSNALQKKLRRLRKKAAKLKQKYRDLITQIAKLELHIEMNG